MKTRQLATLAIACLTSLATSATSQTCGVLLDLNPEQSQSSSNADGPLPDSGLTSKAGFLEMGGLTYFTALTGQYGRELYRTDGTELGTELVFDATPGSANSTIEQFVADQGRLWFVVDGDFQTNGL